MPEEPKDVDALMRKYAADRSAFAAGVPKLHEADVRMIIAEAKRSWAENDTTVHGWPMKLRRWFRSFTTARVAATAFAVVLMALIVVGRNRTVPSTSDTQLYTMATDVVRGGPAIREGIEVYSLEFSLQKSEVKMLLGDGTVLLGTIKRDPGASVGLDAPAVYSIDVSGGIQRQKVYFKGVVTVFPDQINVRGTITGTDIKEIPVTAFLKGGKL